MASSRSVVGFGGGTGSASRSIEAGGTTDVLLTCGTIGPLLFIAVFLVEGALRRDYRPWRHFVSLLSLGERGHIQAANFFLCGAMMLTFTVGLTRVTDGAALPVLFAIFSVALILSGLFAADPALGYPPGTAVTWPPVASRHGTIHNIAGALAFLSIIIATFVVAHAAEGAWMLYSIASGVGMLVAFVGSGVLAERSARGQLADAPVGLVQRISIVIGWSWVAMFALHLAR